MPQATEGNIHRMAKAISSARSGLVNHLPWWWQAISPYTAHFSRGHE
jgi:hypothetical protein